MEIKQIPRKVLADILSARIKCEFSLLALRILVTRLQGRVAKDVANLDACVDELVVFFEKNQHLPSAQRDLLSVSQAGGIRK